MKNLAAPRLVSRNGRAEGILYSLRADVPVVLRPADKMDPHLASLAASVEAAISQVCPGLNDTLRSPEMAVLVAAKRVELERFWSSRLLPVVNEVMAQPLAVVDAGDSVVICYDSDSTRRFDHVLAVRSLIDEYLEGDDRLKERLYDELLTVAELVDGKQAILPCIDATSVGANVVRIVRSSRISLPVAIFTISGALTISGAATGPERARAVLASTGGAVCPRKEGNAEFDVLASANRELAEETSLGFIGTVGWNVALFTQHDGQLATQQVQDLTGVDELDFGSKLSREIDAMRSGATSSVIGFDVDDPGLDDKLTTLEKSLVEHGVTFEFFEAIRSLAPDAGEAERYVAVPLTEECLSYLLLCPWLDKRSWTATMLAALVDCYFGSERADRILALMARDPAVEGGFIEIAARMPISPDLQFLETQLLGY